MSGAKPSRAVGWLPWDLPEKCGMRFFKLYIWRGGGVERTRTPPGLFIADVSQLADNDIGGAGGGAKVFGCCS